MSPHSATGHRSTFCDQIWWKSVVAKFPKGRLVYHTKKLALRGTRASPHFAQNGPIRPKLSERCHPLTWPRIPNLVRSGYVLPDLFWKDWFFGPKSHYNRLSAYKKAASALSQFHLLLFHIVQRQWAWDVVFLYLSRSRQVTPCICERNARVRLWAFLALSPSDGCCRSKPRRATERTVLLTNAMRRTSVTLNHINIRNCNKFRVRPRPVLFSLYQNARAPINGQCTNFILFSMSL